MTRSAHDPRPDEQIRQEQAMGDVSDVLLNIEYAIARAKKGLKRLGDSPEEHNARLALSKAVDELQTTRKRLQRDTYFAGPELRLL
jgi:hypothetical protein